MSEMGPSLISLLFYAVGSICMTILYLVPTWIAYQRRHPQSLAIGVLNLVGGWTVIGWIVAIVWAFTVPEGGRAR